MNDIVTGVSLLVSQELENANGKFPLFASKHEAYAVILEEAEECEAELAGVKEEVKTLWMLVKQNESMPFFQHHVSAIRENAISLALEAIQVAARCDKFTQSFNRKGGDDFE